MCNIGILDWLLVSIQETAKLEHLQKCMGEHLNMMENHHLIYTSLVFCSTTNTLGLWETNMQLWKNTSQKERR